MMRNIGARPWQILHRYPAPQPSATAPFIVGVPILPEQDPGYGQFTLEIRTHPAYINSWLKLPRLARRVGLAIALDMVSARLPEFYQEAGFGPDESEEEIATINQWIETLERWPNINSVPNLYASLIDQLEEILEAYIENQVPSPLATFGDALDLSIEEVSGRATPTPTGIVLLSIAILANWMRPPWSMYRAVSGLEPSTFWVRYRSLPPPAQIQTMMEDASRWIAVWWQEVQNALALRDLPVITK